MPGVTLINTFCRWVHTDASRTASLGESRTIRPTPALTAALSSETDLALPCRMIRFGSTPAASAMASSPAEQTSTPSPSSETQVAIARIISALPAYTISESGKISRYVRQRCRTSASSTTYVGVPYWSAISSRETSPMQTRPRWSWRVLMGHNAGSIRGVIAPRREGKISSSVTSIS